MAIQDSESTIQQHQQNASYFVDPQNQLNVEQAALQFIDLLYGMFREFDKMPFEILIFSEEIHQTLIGVSENLMTYPAPIPQLIFERMKELPISKLEHATFYLSYLYKISQDADYYRMLLMVAFERFDSWSLDEVCGFVWQVRRYLFVDRSYFTAEDRQELQHRQLRQLYYMSINRVKDHVMKRYPRYFTDGKKLERIAVVSPQLLSYNHGPTRDSLSMACHLKKYHGCETFAVNTNTIPKEQYLPFFMGLNPNTNPSFKGHQIIPWNYMTCKDMEIKCFTPEGQGVSIEKIRTVLDYFLDENIQAAIFDADNIYMADFVFDRMPTMYVTTGDVVPLAKVDYLFVGKHLITPFEEDLAKEHGYKVLGRDEFLFSPVEARQEPNRANYGIPEENFVYSIVGTRMRSDLTPEFNEILKKLVQHDKVTLVFAGDQMPNWLDIFTQEDFDNKRVIDIGYQQDLASFFPCADAFLNAFRDGGGTTAQTAMINRLPIVALNDGGHVGATVGPGIVCDTLDDYMTMCLRLKDEPEYQKEMAQKCYDRAIADMDPQEQIGKMYTELNKLQIEYYAPRVNVG